MARWHQALVALAVLAVHPALSWSQTGTVAGDFSVEPPTLVSLGFEWRIAGDDNRNASVDVTYRKKGEQQWRKALPLFRLQRESVNGSAPATRCGAALQSLRRAEHVRRQHPQSRAGHRVRVPLRADRSRRRARQDGEDRHRAHARGAAAGGRRQASITSIRSTTRARSSSPRSPG